MKQFVKKVFGKHTKKDAKKETESREKTEIKKSRRKSIIDFFKKPKSEGNASAAVETKLETENNRRASAPSTLLTIKNIALKDSVDIISSPRSSNTLTEDNIRSESEDDLSEKQKQKLQSPEAEVFELTLEKVLNEKQLRELFCSFLEQHEILVRHKHSIVFLLEVAKYEQEKSEKKMEKRALKIIKQHLQARSKLELSGSLDAAMLFALKKQVIQRFVRTERCAELHNRKRLRTDLFNDLKHHMQTVISSTSLPMFLGSTQLRNYLYRIYASKSADVERETPREISKRAFSESTITGRSLSPKVLG